MSVHDDDQDELKWMYAKVKNAHELLQKMSAMAVEVEAELRHVNLHPIMQDIRTRQDEAAVEFNRRMEEEE